MFKLPNGKQIDEESVIMAMEDNDISNSYYLDTETGEVESVSDLLDLDAKKKREKFDNDRYVEIPQLSSSQLYDWMREYTDEFINREEPEFAENIYIALKDKKPFRRFKDLLEQSEEGWIHGWDQFKRDYMYEEMQDWLLNLSIGIKDEWDYFDDCAICQEMKKADEENRNLTLPELKKAFAKAKNEGAIVGRVEEDKSKSIN